jgi:hypothetical protein
MNRRDLLASGAMLLVGGKGVRHDGKLRSGNRQVAEPRLHANATPWRRSLLVIGSMSQEAARYSEEKCRAPCMKPGHWADSTAPVTWNCAAPLVICSAQ